MPLTIRRSEKSVPVLVLVEAASRMDSPRTDILAEIIRRTMFWRKERLGVGLPARR